MLQILAIATVIRGVRESPSPRMMLPSTLYATIITEPIPQMAMYRCVSAKDSSGAFIARARALESSGISAVSAAPVRKKITTLVPMIRPPSSFFPAPIF